MDVRNEPLDDGETLSARAARSREKLLRAATDLLVEAGPRAVTVDAVAEASGVAKSTLYRHWASRDEMLVAVVRCNIPELEPPSFDDGFEAALRAHLHQIADTLQSPEWSRIVPALMLLRTTMPELAAVADADRQSKTLLLATILDAGIAAGQVPADIDVATTEARLYGPLLFVAMTGNGPSMHELADQVVDGFLARDGHLTPP